MSIESPLRGFRSAALRAIPALAAMLCCAAVKPSWSVEAGGSVFSGTDLVQVQRLATPTTLDGIGRIVIPVRINGQGPFHFVVDTGASSSTLSPGLVRSLGLESEATMLLSGITGAAEVPAVAVHRLQAGDLVISDSLLPVVWAPLMAGADGILGLAGVESHNLVVDFERNQVQLGGRSLPRVRTDLTRIHAMRLFGGLLAFKARVGRVPVSAVIDTGAERTLGNLALRDALNARSGMGNLVKTNVYGATNEVVAGEIQQAPTIVIDTLRITDTAVVYGNFHIFDTWGLQERPALILGMDVLGTVGSLSVDFEHQEVVIARSGGGGAGDMTRSVGGPAGRITH